MSHQHHHDHGHDHVHDHINQYSTTSDMFSTYTHALASVTFISLAPIILLLVLPVDNKVSLKKLLALAAGCLLGDAFLHLIPESSHAGNESQHHHHEQDHDNHHREHNHDHSVGLKVLAGIMIFFILEKYIYSMKLDETSSSPSKKSKSRKKKDDDYVEAHHNHDHSHIHASGILNLIADFLHNFTDGLAIGSSFISGTKLGLSTTFAIFLHEVPHEIGDYAILIQSGFTKRKAIWLQAVTAVGAVSGTIISLLIGSHDERANAWILPFTAGGFIYIATVHLIPQLKNSNFKQTVIELIFFIAGVGIMYLMSWLE